MTEKKIPLEPTTQEEKKIAADAANNKTGAAETAAAVAENAKENAKAVAERAKTRVVTDPVEARRLGVRVGDTVPVNKLAQWKCHKTVTAGKILAFGASFTDPITVEDVKGEEHKVDDMPSTIFANGRPSLGDYILLDDAASVSWKTAKEFERDYARVDGKKDDRDKKTRVVTDREYARLLGVRVGDTVPDRERGPNEQDKPGFGRPGQGQFGQGQTGAAARAEPAPNNPNKPFG